ncbi:MAG: DNA translocase FtsK 4TM domain-containing protein [Gemmatimonadota bacterium]
MTGSKTKGKAKAKRRILGPERRQEILALGLMAVALFLFLLLVPTSLLGEAGEVWFPSGNVMGAVGAAVQAVLHYFFGLASLFLPALLVLAGFQLGGWLSHTWTLRLAILIGGLFLLVPPGLHVLLHGSAAAGILGSWLGNFLVAGLGGFGALLLLSVLTLLLLVGTLGWNPLLPVGRVAVQGAELIGKGAQRAGRGVQGWLKDGVERRAARALAQREAMEAPEESDLFSFIDDDELPGGTPLGDPALDAFGGSEAAPEDAPEDGGGAGGLPDPNPPGEDPPHELPSLHHLDEPDFSDRAGMERDLDRLGQVLVQKLQTFNVECSIGGRTTGPVVTQFEVVPAPGVKVNKIANLDADLALAMKARSIRIVAPIPGKGAVGVEIPNPKAEMVYLREILESVEFSRSRAELPLALGRDLTGRPFVADLAKMPHALIAGATGSGKSVCLNAFITSLVYRHTPETLRFLLIDPKMVELSAYVDLPHLRHPVVTDPKDAAGVMKWAVFEMERRYELLHVNTVRSVGEFNKKLRQGAPLRRVHPKGPDGDPDRWLWKDGPIPYVVLVVDELADLMMTVQSEVEKPLTLLAQKARAIGIHLLVATQRPSVNVITGLIKANFPTRVAFRVASKVDSRTIIDQNGADALLGNGDMLFLPPGTSEPIRIQGAFIGTPETERLTSWYRDQAALRTEREAKKEERWPAEEDILDVVRSLEADSGMEEGGLGGDLERDERFWDAAEVCVQQSQGSTSLLQRRLKIGYGRAARVVDQLHEAGILGPPDGSKAREVLLTLSDLEFLRRGEEEEL